MNPENRGEGRGGLLDRRPDPRGLLLGGHNRLLLARTLGMAPGALAALGAGGTAGAGTAAGTAAAAGAGVLGTGAGSAVSFGAGSGTSMPLRHRRGHGGRPGGLGRGGAATAGGGAGALGILGPSPRSGRAWASTLTGRARSWTATGGGQGRLGGGVATIAMAAPLSGPLAPLATGFRLDGGPSRARRWSAGRSAGPASARRADDWPKMPSRPGMCPSPSRQPARRRADAGPADRPALQRRAREARRPAGTGRQRGQRPKRGAAIGDRGQRRAEATLPAARAVQERAPARKR